MDYMTINGYSIPYPNDFEMKKEPNIVSEIVTMSGKTIADVNGWKYANTTLKWDTLLDSDLQNLLSALADPSFDIVFTGLDGQSHTVEAVFRGLSNTKTPLLDNGVIVWQDLTVELSFPDCYQ